MQCNGDDLYRVRDKGAFWAYLFICSFILLFLQCLSFGQDFSGTITARSLKLGMQRNNDDLHRVRDSGLSRHICSFALSFLFLFILANDKFLVKDFSGVIKARSLKPGMQCSSSFSPDRPLLIFFVKDFLGTVKVTSLKLGILCNDDDFYCVRDNGPL